MATTTGANIKDIITHEVAKRKAKEAELNATMQSNASNPDGIYNPQLAASARNSTLDRSGSM